MRVIQSVQFHGWYIPGTRIDVDIVQVGPSMVHLHFSTPFGKVMLIETVTPVQPLLQRITHQVFAGTPQQQPTHHLHPLILVLSFFLQSGPCLVSSPSSSWAAPSCSSSATCPSGTTRPTSTTPASSRRYLGFYFSRFSGASLLTSSPGIKQQDGPIAKYRRWFAKNFYSENSEKVARDRAAATGSIDW